MVVIPIFYETEPCFYSVFNLIHAFNVMHTRSVLHILLGSTRDEGKGRGLHV